MGKRSQSPRSSARYDWRWPVLLFMLLQVVLLLAALASAQSTLPSLLPAQGADEEPPEDPTTSEDFPIDDPTPIQDKRRENQDAVRDHYDNARSDRSPWDHLDSFFRNVLFGSPAQVAVAGAAVATTASPLLFPRSRRVLAGLAGAMWGLFSRLQRNALLDQGTRMQLFEAIQTEPGITQSELRRRLGLSTGVLLHHLRMLEYHGTIRSRRVQGFRIYNVAGLKMPENLTVLSQAQQRFLEALRELGAASRIQLAAHLGMTPQAIGYHARILKERGLVNAWYHKRELHCSLGVPPLATAPAAGPESLLARPRPAAGT